MKTAPAVPKLHAGAVSCLATVGQIVGDQLMELRERLELMDRKTNALLRNALEQRRTN